MEIEVQTNLQPSDYIRLRSIVEIESDEGGTKQVSLKL